MTMPDLQLHTQPLQVSVTHFGHNCLRSPTAQADSMVLPGVRIGSTNSSSSRSLPSSFLGKVKAYGLLKQMSYPFSVLASGLLQQELQPMAALVGSPSCSGQGRARAAPTAAPSPSHQRSAAMLLSEHHVHQAMAMHAQLQELSRAANCIPCALHGLALSMHAYFCDLSEFMLFVLIGRRKVDCSLISMKTMTGRIA